MNRRQALFGAAALAACNPAASSAPPPLFPMRRGINLGNALEAPNEGDWGYRIEPAHIEAIADAGFDGIRLPVRWDAHAAPSPPYAIDEALLRRVETIVYSALGKSLIVQLDLHHYDALIAAPAQHRDRFLALWDQIARFFHAAPPALLFEPLNEPNGPAWDGAALTALQTSVLATIRASNPDRTIVFGPGNWNSIDGLRRWTPPEDPNIAISVHYYEPHAFTHDSAEWLGAAAPHFGRPWGARADRAALVRDIERAANWARERSLPLQIGEFGVNRALPLAQRALWTSELRRAAEANQLGWCAWDFAGAFPIWDRASQNFIPEMRGALLDQ